MNKKKIRNILLIATSVVCVIAVVFGTAIKLSQPVVTVHVREPFYYTNQQEQEEKCGVHMYISIDSKKERFVECVVQLSYDPDVLQCADSICWTTDNMKHIRKVTVQKPGMLLITVLARGDSYTDPICFNLFSDEEIDLNISLVSYTDEGGVRENAQLVVDMPVKVPVVKDLS